MKSRYLIKIIDYHTKNVSNIDLTIVNLNYVLQPLFGDKLCILGSRHPILEHIKPEVVPNDIFADEDNKMVILTGLVFI